jgi:hypothetical protein
MIVESLAFTTLNTVHHDFFLPVSLLRRSIIAVSAFTACFEALLAA